MTSRLHRRPPAETPFRQTGIPVVGAVPWGEHFCQFYQTSADLTETLVPYFKEGLAANEFCMWVTSAPLSAEEAKAALRAAMPDLDEHMARGQIEILDYTQWYTKSGKFNADEVLGGWVDKLESAKKRGFEGLRLTGNTFWLEAADWDDFTRYEEKVNAVIGQYKMIALCTYSLDKCGASEIIDVVNNHRFALIKRHGKWEMMQSARVRAIDEKARLREFIPRGKPNFPVKALSAFIAAAGLAVMAGWIFDIDVLKSPHSALTSMKFVTAFSFVVGGISLYYMARAREGGFEAAQVALSITSFILAILMGLLFFSSVFRIDTGIGNLFVRDAGGARCVIPGMPSIPTMINFLLIAAAGIMTIVNPGGVLAKLKAIGVIVGSIGMLAVAGYIFNAPQLYYYIAGFNSAMALHTALLFMVFGAGLACL